MGFQVQAATEAKYLATAEKEAQQVSLYLPTCPPTCPPAYLPTYLPTQQPACLPTQQPIYLLLAVRLSDSIIVIGHFLPDDLTFWVDLVR